MGLPRFSLARDRSESNDDGRRYRHVNDARSGAAQVLQRGLVPTWRNPLEIELSQLSDRRVDRPTGHDHCQLPIRRNDRFAGDLDRDGPGHRQDAGRGERDDGAGAKRRCNPLEQFTELVVERDVLIVHADDIAIIGQQIRNEQVAVAIRSSDLLIARVAAHPGDARHADQREALFNRSGREHATADRDQAASSAQRRAIRSARLYLLDLVATVSVLVLQQRSTEAAGLI
jgi:hypothetical protein